jgi:hypothetical protein
MPYERLRTSADAAQLAALESLSAELRLVGIDRGRESLDVAAQAATNRDQADEALKETVDAYQKVCKNIRVSLVTRWPELANPWSAQVADVVAGEGEKIVQAIETHDDFAALQRYAARRKRLTDERWQQDRRYAKAMRLARILEDVAIAGNLRTSAPSEQWQRFEQLVALENQKLLPTMSNQPTPEIR